MPVAALGGRRSLGGRTRRVGSPHLWLERQQVPKHANTGCAHADGGVIIRGDSKSSDPLCREMDPCEAPARELIGPVHPTMHRSRHR
jgi:hypothetical protein